MWFKVTASAVPPRNVHRGTPFANIVEELIPVGPNFGSRFIGSYAGSAENTFAGGFSAGKNDLMVDCAVPPGLNDVPLRPWG